MMLLFALALLGRGRLVENVVCASDPSQSYTLYLPRDYTVEQRWPVLIVLDPRGRATVAAELFREAAEANGWIVFSSNNSRSDAGFSINDRAVNAILGDVAQYSVDRNHMYVAGFSGTATYAWLFARQGKLAGVIAAGQPDTGDLDPSHAPFAYWASVGTSDFNYLDAKRLERELAASKQPHHLEIFSGAHGWMPKDLAGRAIDWMQFHATRRDAEQRYAVEMREAAALGESAEALGRYREIARDFDSKDARGRVALLESSRIVKRQVARERDAEEYESQTIDAMSAVLRRILAADPTPPLDRIERELDLTSVKKTAARNDERGLAARRVLEQLYVQTSFYLPEKYRARRDPARVTILQSLAAAVKAQ